MEVFFRAGATTLAVLLAQDMQSFLREDTPGPPPPESQRRIAEVLLRHNVQASGSSFLPRFIQRQAEELERGEVPEAIARLPRLQRFVRLEFAAPAAAAAAAGALTELPEVERARVVPQVMPPQARRIPDDPFIGTPDMGIRLIHGTDREPQWYLHRTSVLDAWAEGARGAGVVIVDIDWGYRTTHQELRLRLEMAHAFNSADGTPCVSQGSRTAHGTAVMGLAGAAADGAGMAGYAPEAGLWPLQGNSDLVKKPLHDPWANAIEHVLTEDSRGRRKVILLELETGKGGNCEQIDAVNVAVRHAIASRAVVCVPAGNGNRPAHLADDGRTQIDETGSILVGATDWDERVDRRAEFSNWGPWIVVSAPGDLDHDLTCDETSDSQYRNDFGGTSGAAAKVAGVAALVLSVDSTLTHEQVREILRRTGTPILPNAHDEEGADKPVGTLVNAFAAVKRARLRAALRAPASPCSSGRPVIPDQGKSEPSAGSAE
ncbi:MAG TPA: S8 family serine peptidase [Longimicrobium sp.]|nr:S8 family serine peptidase [Longimicrobium sp.]